MNITFYLYEKYQKTSGWPRQAIIKLYRTWVVTKAFFIKILFKISGKPLKIRNNQTDSAIFDSVFGANELKILVPIKKDFVPKLIIDAGAYGGYTSVWLSRKYPESQIYALEPEQSNFELLKHNTQFYKNVFVLKKALWPTSTNLFVRDMGTGDWGFKMETDKNDSIESVSSTTVQDILSQSKLPYVDILKIDIEGGEKDLFENCNEWIDKVNIIIVELHDWFAPGCTESYNKMRSQGEWAEYTSGVQKILIRKHLLA